MSEVKRIGFDISHLANGAGSGIASYIQNLALHLIDQNHPNCQVVPIANINLKDRLRNFSAFENINWYLDASLKQRLKFWVSKFLNKQKGVLNKKNIDIIHHGIPLTEMRCPKKYRHDSRFDHADFSSVSYTC